MNWTQIEGKWDQVRGQARQQWGKLTDDDWTAAKGSREELVGRIKERYGIAEEEAQKQIDRWMDGIRNVVG